MGLDKIILPVILKKVKEVMFMIVLREITKAYLNSEKNKKNQIPDRVSVRISQLQNESEAFTGEFLF
ncbi:MAG: hypothetical protein ACLTXO_13160 [Fusobacterium varium]